MGLQIVERGAHCTNFVTESILHQLGRGRNSACIVVPKHECNVLLVLFLAS